MRAIVWRVCVSSDVPLWVALALNLDKGCNTWWWQWRHSYQIMTSTTSLVVHTLKYSIFHSIFLSLNIVFVSTIAIPDAWGIMSSINDYWWSLYFLDENLIAMGAPWDCVSCSTMQLVLQMYKMNSTQCLG